MASLRIRALGVVAAGLFPACSPATSDAATEDEEIEGGLTPDDPSARTPYIECSVDPGDHAAATCVGGPCPIVNDIELRCPDYQFGVVGVEVAATPNATWIGTASANDSMLFRVAPEGGVERVLLPEHCVWSPIHLAVDAPGDLHVATVVPMSTRSDASGVVYLTERDDWSEQIVVADEVGAPEILGFDVDGGTPRIWLDTPSHGSYREVSPVGEIWEERPVGGVTDGYGSERFTRDRAGRLLAADRVRADGLWFLDVLVDGALMRLGLGSDADTYHPRFTLHARTVPSDAPGPPFAAVVEDAGGIQVVWPASDGADGALVLDGFVHLEYHCATKAAGPGGTCDQSCEDHGEGYPDATTSFTRTTDGVGWAIVVTTARDVTYSYELQCLEANDCSCGPVVADDASVSTLHLLRVPLDGAAPAEVLSLSFAGLGGPGTHIHAFGTSLAIGLPIYDPFTDDIAVRVLRIESAALAP